MDYLKGVGFLAEEIDNLTENIPKPLYKLLVTQEKLVYANISILKEMGIGNYKEIFSKFYEIFLMDNSLFKKMLEKYETDDLIKHLEKDINVFEYL